MAGLDTRGLASGFAQGFGLMNQYQQQQFQNERALKQDEMQEQKFGLDMQMGQMRMDEVEREREKEALTFALARGAEFGPEGLSEDDIALLRNKPQVWAAFDERADPAIQRAADVFDLNSPADANDPDSLEQANILFQDLVNRGEGGQKRIARFYPAPDGQSVNIELEVTREDGTVDYQPMTDGRGTEEDAMVMNVPMEGLVNHIQGLRQVRNGINMGGDEFRANASRMLRVLRGDATPESWEQVEGPGGSILQRNTRTGETKQVIGRAPQSGGNYWDRPTATQKDIEYLVSNGLAPSREAAWQMLNRSNDSSRDELKYYTGRLEDIESILSAPGAANTMSDEELAQFQSERQAIRDMLPELESRAFGRQPAGLSIPASRQSSTTASSSTDQPPQPEGERGLRPGPSPSEPLEDDLLNSILRDL
ncbi:hypothetical protein J4377_13425 [Halomonas sp. XH26]|uniref:hypothetical protein n=1 Tax=Halomonas sp. XH26 TaxID=2557993 RepID=UPI00209F8CF8|nr:hypothetical protein [Halomonas sp. XH26]UTA78953.1 hypothetical protein J4377_13425 [Halomonas sp. XH26]